MYVYIQNLDYKRCLFDTELTLPNYLILLYSKLVLGVFKISMYRTILLQESLAEDRSRAIGEALIQLWTKMG